MWEMGVMRLLVLNKMRLLMVLSILSAALLTGCSVSRVNGNHSLIQKDMSQSYATVYFIRPNTEHPMGFSDNAIAVDVDGEKLISLAKGEYTLVHLKPRKVDVKLRDLAQLRGRWEVEEMSWRRQLDLSSGETYYVLAKPVNGEFRGVRFMPTQLSLHEARQAAKDLRAVGAAKENPIPF